VYGDKDARIGVLTFARVAAMVKRLLDKLWFAKVYKTSISCRTHWADVVLLLRPARRGALAWATGGRTLASLVNASTTSKVSSLIKRSFLKQHACPACALVWFLMIS
jgi:hypothetical protein